MFLEYIYCGVVTVEQGSLKAFLQAAELLGIRGISRNLKSNLQSKQRYDYKVQLKTTELRTKNGLVTKIFLKKRLRNFKKFFFFVD